MRQLDIQLPLYHSNGIASKTFIEMAGNAAEGVKFPAAALIVAEQLSDDNPQKAVLLAYRDKFEKLGKEVSTFGGRVYDALFITPEAMDRTESTDKVKVRDEIEKTRNFSGTGGIFNYGPVDHLGLGEVGHLKRVRRLRGRVGRHLQHHEVRLRAAEGRLHG